MKKLFACASLAVAMMLSTSAMAAVTSDADITEAEGVVTNADIAADTYKTVLIYAGETTDAPTEANIEYVNTYSTAISSATTFALKNEGANGKYVMMLGGAGTLEEPVAATKVAFEITDDPVGPTNSNPMTAAGSVTNEGGLTKNLGFTMGTVTISDYNSVIVEVGGTKLAWDIEAVFGTISGETTVNAALEVQNVPVDATASVYFSTYVIGGNN